MLLVVAVVLVVLLCCGNVQAKQETWSSNLSALKIGVSHEGFSRAVVDCGADEVAFVITMDEDFEGSLYTRGSYHAKNSACFRDADGGKDFALKFGYDDCGMKYDAAAGGHTTTVIVQHDDDLIFPGDLAFNILCRLDSDSRDMEQTVRSRITLVDADPGASQPEDGTKQHSASSQADVVTLLPPPPHEEL